jgi:hypothetical protein
MKHACTSNNLFLQTRSCCLSMQIIDLAENIHLSYGACLKVVGIKPTISRDLYRISSTGTKNWYLTILYLRPFGHDNESSCIYNIFISIDRVFSLTSTSFQNKSYWDSAFCFGITENVHVSSREDTFSQSRWAWYWYKYSTEHHADRSLRSRCKKCILTPFFSSAAFFATVDSLVLAFKMHLGSHHVLTRNSLSFTRVLL